MSDDIEWADLGRFLAGECTPEQAEGVRRWVDSDPAHRQLLDELGAAWDTARTPMMPWDTPAAWRRLAARIRSRERGPGLAVVPSTRLLPQARPRHLSATTAATAAAVALLLAGALSWGLARTGGVAEEPVPAPLREVRVPMGQRAQFQLAEGTRVLLGPGSVLRYDTTSFGDSTRELHLDGQAHFVVVHDPGRPFIVRTARTLTEDLGTEFAITDYAADSAGVVVVASGTVAVRGLGADTARAATLLQGGDLVRLAPGGRATVERGVSLAVPLAWTEGRLVFTDTPVGEVVTRINRWYGGDVRLDDPALATLRFTAAYGAAAEATVVRELAAAIGARVEHRGSSTLIVPVSDHSRER